MSNILNDFSINFNDFSITNRCKALDCLAVVEFLKIKLQSDDSQVILVCYYKNGLSHFSVLCSL